jgi:hypothetical protein
MSERKDTTRELVTESRQLIQQLDQLLKTAESKTSKENRTDNKKDLPQS